MAEKVAKTKIWVSYSGLASSKLLNDVDTFLESTECELKRFERSVAAGAKRSENSLDAAYKDDKDSPDLNGETVKQYYLSPGESINSLIVTIAYQSRLLFCLSDEYFLSPYCLAELACSLCFTDSLGFRFIDQMSDRYDLKEILLGEQLVKCQVPGGKARKMRLNEALAETMKARYEGDQSDVSTDVSFLMDAEQYEKLLEKLPDKIFCEPEAALVKDTIVNLARVCFFSGTQYDSINNFSNWIESNSIASRVFNAVDWKKSNNLFSGAAANVYLDYKTGRSDNAETRVDLIELLQEYKSNSVQRRQLPAWVDFIKVLAGFVAQSLVSEQWLNSVAAAPGSVIFIERNEGSSSGFQACIGHAALTGSGAKLKLDRRVQKPVSESLVDIGVMPEFPLKQGRSFSRQFVCALWSNLRNLPIEEIPDSDSGNPTGLDREQRGLLCSWIREQQRFRGAGACALYLDLKDYEINEQWEGKLMQALRDLRDNGARRPLHDLRINTLVVPVAADRANVQVLKDGSDYFDRFNLVNKILELEFDDPQTN
ncbi:hypothetical protein AB833_15805 [Chromatiales bacterium (ex Bugula neritina AB1)]|nr:hypothetical protein AB833_15805 [Chromatiales bacterium (ex Bugula neritina AB1)]